MNSKRLNGWARLGLAGGAAFCAACFARPVGAEEHPADPAHATPAPDPAAPVVQITTTEVPDASARTGSGGNNIYTATTVPDTAPPAAVRDAFRLVATVVQKWGGNATEVMPPGNLTYYRNSFPATISLGNVVEIDDKGVAALDRIKLQAEGQRDILVAKYAEKLNRLYRARLSDARAALKPDDQAFFDLVLKGWSDCDAALNKISEPNFLRREALLKSACAKASADFLATVSDAARARLLKLAANFAGAPTKPAEQDADLCLFFGRTRLEFDAVFPGALKPDARAKADHDYLTARDKLHTEFTAALKAAYADLEKQMVAAVPAAADRAAVQKLIDWNVSHAAALEKLNNEYNRMVASFYSEKGSYARNRDSYSDLSEQLKDLHAASDALWPDRFKDKVPKEPAPIAIQVLQTEQPAN